MKALTATLTILIASCGASSSTNIKIQLLDVRTTKPIANSDVEVWSDNGVRCNVAPCPTNGKAWNGKSDARGHVVIPRSFIQETTVLSTPGHDGKSLELAAGSPPTLVVELVPKDPNNTGLPERAFKLFDAATNKPLDGVGARVELGSTERLETKTNALGYIFIPLEKAMPVLDDTWVVASGHQRTKVDFEADLIKLAPK